MRKESDPKPTAQDASPPPPRKRRRRWRRLGMVLLVLVALLGIARAIMPWAVRRYVNQTLDRSLLYQGEIGDVQIHLWRGAYSIDDLRISKVTGNVPVPFYSAKRVEFTVQWDALRHRKLVGQIVMQEPELNFVDSSDPSEAQTGQGGPWLQMMRDLFPFKINSAKVHDGSIHFRTYEKKQPVDVYLSHLEASIDNLTNVYNDTAPLITTVDAYALAMDQAKFEYHMKLDPFSYRPTYHMATRLLGLDVTKTNNLARTYGAFDFKRGWFDLVIEMDVKEGQMTGYVKPLFRSLKVFSLKQDIKQDNVLEFFWQALVGAATFALKNQSRDQFGTLIPFRGDISNAQPDILATVGNVLRNAFIRAYLPRLQKDVNDKQDLEFEPPSPIETGSAGDQS